MLLFANRSVKIEIYKHLYEALDLQKFWHIIFIFDFQFIFNFLYLQRLIFLHWGQGEFLNVLQTLSCILYLDAH